MPNTKAVGVAYADPEFESVSVSGAAVVGSLSAGSVVSTAASGAVASNANAGVYILSTAITANSTATTAPKGSLGLTTNSTGVGKLFYSDGSKWQFAAIS